MGDGSIKWQIKEFDINWTNYTKTGKKHLVTYILRDHFSNCFYAELHSVDKMPLINDFLYNAWTQKNDYPFYGIPSCLIVPDTTLNLFPTLHNYFAKVDKPYLQKPTSGFSSAVVSIRQWERFIKYFTGIYKDCKTLTDFQQRIDLINNETNTFVSSKSKVHNLSKWLDNNPKITKIVDKENFHNLFK